MRPTLLALMTMTAAACAGSSAGPAPAGSPVPEPPRPAPAATTVMRRAAEATPPKPAIATEEDLGGSYGVSLSYGGQPLDLTLQLGKRPDGTWGGSVYVEQAGTIPFRAVMVDGNAVQASLNSPDGAQVSMEFRIEKSDLSGAWTSSNGDGSPLRGRRLP